MDKYTPQGYVALLLWASSAALTASLSNLPPFQVISTILFLSSVVAFVRSKAWKNFPIINLYDPGFWLGTLGIGGQQIFFVLAFQRAPPLHIDLIVYLWPLFVVVLSSVIAKKNCWIELIGACIAFLGIYLLFKTPSFNGLSIGYLYALLCAITWSLYTVLKRYYKTSSGPVFIYCIIGSMLTATIHVCTETFIWPTNIQLLTILFVGLVIAGNAYYMWDRAIQKGNVKVLSILAYANPIISVLLLIACGYETMGWHVALSTLCVVMGSAFALVSHYRQRRS